MKQKILIFILALFGIVGATFAIHDSSNKSGGYNSPILLEGLNFEAEYVPDQGYVVMEWKDFTQLKNESFKYYKVIKSTNNPDPVYPDDGYIQVITNPAQTRHQDYKLQSGTNYYRVCAITNEQNRYCSNVVKIYIQENNYTPPSDKSDKGDKSGDYNTYYGLSAKVKAKLDTIVKNFIDKLNQKYDDEDTIQKAINNVITKLEQLKQQKPKYTYIVKYLIQKLEDHIQDYIPGDIQDIFDQY